MTVVSGDSQDRCACGRFAIAVVDDLRTCSGCSKVRLGMSLGAEPITYTVTMFYPTVPSFLVAHPIFNSFRKESELWTSTISVQTL